MAATHFGRREMQNGDAIGKDRPSFHSLSPISGTRDRGSFRLGDGRIMGVGEWVLGGGRELQQILPNNPLHLSFFSHMPTSTHPYLSTPHRHHRSCHVISESSTLHLIINADASVLCEWKCFPLGHR